MAGYEILRQGNKKAFKPWESLNVPERAVLMRIFTVAFATRDRKQAEELSRQMSGRWVEAPLCPYIGDEHDKAGLVFRPTSDPHAHWEPGNDIPG
jgi:hypothetical protein